MEEALLQSGPSYPPAAWGPVQHPPPGQGPPLRITDLDGKAVKDFYTHGGNLRLEFRGDLWYNRLLHLVIRCLADLPEDRPTLRELMGWVNLVETTMPGYNDPDTWYQDILATPPTVSTRVAFVLCPRGKMGTVQCG